MIAVVAIDFVILKIISYYNIIISYHAGIPETILVHDLLIVSYCKQLTKFSLFSVKSCAVKTDNGHCCVFPFTYKNKKHTSCIPSVRFTGRSWCATTSTYLGGSNWGYCKGNSYFNHEFVNISTCTHK